jgi:hypothetical protein
MVRFRVGCRILSPRFTRFRTNVLMYYTIECPGCNVRGGKRSTESSSTYAKMDLPSEIKAEVPASRETNPVGAAGDLSGQAGCGGVHGGKGHARRKGCPRGHRWKTKQVVRR